MAKIQLILPTVDKILKRYNLCNYCLGRLFSRQMKLTSNKLLGKRLQKYDTFENKCYICKNIYSDIDSFLDMMIQKTTKYQFNTFLTGTQIKPSIIDRDDFIRSEFRLVGVDGIKSDINRELSKQFAKKTGKIIDVFNPDLTFVINIKEKSCNIHTKHVILCGRYTKTTRGFAQKQKSCTNCSGKGGLQCNHHGNYTSVEGKISKMLFAKFECTSVRFTWIGGEDQFSLVLGTGRPFFAKMYNPVKNNVKLAHEMQLDFVNLYDCKIIDKLPTMPIKFSSTIKIKISTNSELNSQLLRKLKSELHNIVIYENSGKRSERSISHVRYRKLSGTEFILVVDAEGGIPIKRFVVGDNITPNVSQILGIKCSCVTFDFMNITIA